jgi:Flp pilus assembly pilin Flp
MYENLSVIKSDSIGSRPQEGTEPRRRFRRDDESGLTTLEWLLIVAAVAGLAALAVVLVTNVVDDTAEQISGSSARRTAAVLAATEINRDANRDDTAQPRDAKTFGDWVTYYTEKCDRLEITFADAGITSTANIKVGTSSGNAEATDAVKITAIDSTKIVADALAAPSDVASRYRASATNPPLGKAADSGKAIAECFINQ